MNRNLLILLFIIIGSFVFTSCMINKHYYEYYETDIPTTYNFDKKTFNKYPDYCVEGVYCKLETLATNYYPNKKRESAPYKIEMSCISLSLNYENIVFKNIKIHSNLGNEYLPKNDIDLLLKEFPDKKGNMYLISRYRNGQKLDSFNFKHSENEILTVTMDAVLYDKDGKTFSKSLQYILYPKTKVEYIDLLFDLF